VVASSHMARTNSWKRERVRMHQATSGATADGPHGAEKGRGGALRRAGQLVRCPLGRRGRGRQRSTRSQPRTGAVPGRRRGGWRPDTPLCSGKGHPWRSRLGGTGTAR
jgi:hypothetical protein